MEVILREDIENLGARGQVVKVKEGYARNFLIPRRMAVMATEANRKVIEQERSAWLRKEAKVKEDAESLAALMANVSVTIKAKAGENEQLFGSVTKQDIAGALEAQNFTIDTKKIVLDEPIKQLGDYKIAVKLHKEVSIEIPVHVVAEG
jgi:large subunit ribosomal protein L9